MVDPAVEAAFADAFEARYRPLQHVSALSEVPDYFRVPPEPGEIFEEVPAEQMVAVKVLTLQQIDTYITMWVSTGTSVDDVKRRVSASLLTNPLALRIEEAKPKLPDDLLTVCLTPTWWDQVERASKLGGSQLYRKIVA